VADYILWFALDRSKVKFRKLFDLRAERESDDYSADPLKSGGYRPGTTFDYEYEGRTFRCKQDEHWKVTREGLDRLAVADRLAPLKESLRFKRYWQDFPVKEFSNIWMGFGGASDIIYVVQTNRRLVERCLLMSTDPGDLVLDPTCGSGTTAFVAEQWGRRWITVDTSRVALALARQRLMGARFPYYMLADSVEGRAKESALSATSLPPAAPTNDIRHGFVYERVPHVALKSIANNPDIRKGMSRGEIDAAIRRHADFELLYDRPYEDTKRVRVTGPFTVESLSPHRSLSFASTSEPIAERAATEDPDAPTFEQTVLENLRVAGVQNGRKAERLEFDVVETYAGTHIQAVGIREEAPEGAPKRVGLSIGPQYGTVSATFVKDAARESGKDMDLDLLCVLAFAFEPQVLGSNDDFLASDAGFDVAAERSLGRIPVLLVRMNADLLMGEDLKKTGAGNLFTVFGEPAAQRRRRVRPHHW
jgi:adenine-specific DNA-methyltransferase